MDGISAQAAPAEGMVFIHSAPAALLPHIEWALGRHLGGPVGLQWSPQPLKPGHFRSQHAWLSTSSFGAMLTSELLGWGSIAFEIVQDEGKGHAGWRWIFTPSLGLFQGQIDALGNALVNQHRLVAITDLDTSNLAEIRSQILLAIGEPWDRELEHLRQASDDSAVIWLRSVAN